MAEALIGIVDDDDAVRAATGMLVASFGWRARTFGSATAFLDELAPGDAPDCLLLDLNMPGMNGAELLRVLEARGSTLPVIVITGNSESALAEIARRAGARAVLDKPVCDDELKLEIERVLRMPPPARPARAMRFS
ncbi:MAG: response regulator [Nevskia sp.]|nr:response regulator [Nevskia sp.]